MGCARTGYPARRGTILLEWRLNARRLGWLDLVFSF